MHFTMRLLNKQNNFLIIWTTYFLSSCIGSDFDFDKFDDNLNINPGFQIALVKADDIELGSFINLNKIESVQSYEEDGYTKWVYQNKEEQLATIKFEDVFNNILTDINNNLIDTYHDYNFNIKQFISSNLDLINQITGETYSSSEVSALSPTEINTLWSKINFADIQDKLVSIDERYVDITPTDYLELHAINADLQLSIIWDGFPYAAKVEIDFENITSPNEPEIQLNNSTTTHVSETFSFSQVDVIIDPEIMQLKITSKITLLELPKDDFNTQIKTSYQNIVINSVTGVFSNISSSFENQFSIKLDELGNIVSGVSFLKPSIHIPLNNQSPLSGSGTIKSTSLMSDDSERMISTYDPLEVNANCDQQLSLDYKNSNIVDLFDGVVIPESFLISGSFSLDSKQTSVTLSPNNFIEMGYHITIPFYLKIVDLKYENLNAAKINLSESEKKLIDKAARLGVMINYTSEFPVNANVILNLLDENQNTTSTIVLENAVEATEINEAGITISPITKQHAFHFTEEQIDAIQNTYAIKPIISLHTNSKAIELITDYKIDFTMSLLGDINP
ncbi:MAG: hypothetical protein ACK5IJ_06475 [Mangrovibacterium sp.]